jgi:hypothetical protein
MLSIICPFLLFPLRLSICLDWNIFTSTLPDNGNRGNKGISGIVVRIRKVIGAKINICMDNHLVVGNILFGEAYPVALAYKRQGS